MVNPGGKNGYDKKEYPPDDVLREVLLGYSRKNLSQQEKLSRLAKDCSLSIKKTKLNELERRLEIPSVRRPFKSKEELTQSVIEEAGKDLQMGAGPNVIKTKLRIKDIPIARDRVRVIMHEHFPAGAALRFPGRKKAEVHREPLFAIGPYHEISGDGHEKIGSLALQMGGIGLPIYGYRDKWSGALLKIEVVPNCRSPGVVGHLYLDLVEELNGIPLQLNVDKGSEIGWEVAFQDALRRIFAESVDPEVYPTVALLKSIHNIIIESLWRWLREKSGHNLRTIILFGKENGLIRPELASHRNLFYWIFVPLVQAELNEFQQWWNLRTVRKQSGKYLPSGHVPLDAIEHPEMFGGLNCLVNVPRTAIQELRNMLNERVGPRDDFRAFYSEDFDAHAHEIHRQLNLPTPSLFNAWSQFTAICSYL